MTTKVKLTINGREVMDLAGKPLLKTALDAGIEIPHFCYHPGLGVDGNCRLCLVQIDGIPKLQTSCTVPIREGMVVSSESEAVRKARKGVLEFFLLNHPLDCPICDKGGECPLQNYALDAGQSESRFEFPKLLKEKHRTIGEHIVLDKERCVLCNRCVRFLRNFTGREELQIRNRGADSEIFIPEGTALTSGFTGNLADICPVGALTTREFRFRARPWELKISNTVCGECGLGCAAQSWRKGSDVMRLTPRIESDVNEWWLCDRGRFSVHTRLTEDRLKSAVQAGDGKDPLTPEAVADAIVAGIRNVPRGDMAFVADATMTNEEFHRLKALACAADGRVFVPALREVVELRSLLKKEQWSDGFPGTLDGAKAVLVAGERMEEDHPVLVLRLRRLHHAFGLKVFTAGGAKMGFEDIEAGHTDVKEDGEAIAEFFRGLTGKDTGTTHVLLTDRWVNNRTVGAIRNWLEAAIQPEEARPKVALLLTGANLAGILDQWDAGVRSAADLERDIQRGKVQGLLWFGKALTNPVFDEYARGMRIFTQAVLKRSEAHPRARWILPLDSFLEKKGTYTNTFGRVQAVRRATRLIEKGFEPLSLIPALSARLGAPDAAEVEVVYEELVRELPGYPRRMSEIPEAAGTYRHYERALWR